MKRASASSRLFARSSIPCTSPRVQVLALALRWGGKFVEAFLKMLPLWRHLLLSGHQPEFQLLVGPLQAVPWAHVGAARRPWAW